jgi:hypothetical protein
MKKTCLYILFGAILSVSSAQATRVLEILERSYELALADVSLPATASGAIGFKTCGSCAREYMSVDASTRYFLGGQPITLVQLTQEVNQIRLAASTLNRTMVVLHYGAEDGVATRIRVDTL